MVVIDFEGTTPAGYPPEPTGVGALILRLHLDGLSCEKQYEELIRPPAHAPLTTADTRQTGITAVMLADRPTAPVVLGDLDALLTEPPYVTVAHHAPSEAGILRRYARACPRLAAAPMIDTLRLARACYPDFASHSLDALLAYLHILMPADRHRALAAVHLTAHLLHRLLDDGGTRHRWSQLAQLRHLARCPRRPRAAIKASCSAPPRDPSPISEEGPM